MATLDGEEVLGIAVHIQPVPNPRATQRDSYAGQPGYTVLDGGARGGRFHMRGVMVGETPAACYAFIQALLDFAGGGVHTLIDTQGNEWDYVYFDGVITPSANGPVYSDQGWLLPYEAVMETLQ